MTFSGQELLRNHETRGSMLSAARVLRFCFVAVAGALAAAVAHVVIDVAGDYLLTRDAYDGLAHNSRTVLLAAVGIAVLMAAIRTIFDALDRRCGSRISLLALVRSELGRPWRFVGASVAVATVLLMAMEAFDCSLVGHVDGLDDLFGGSLLLGLTTVAITGLLCGWGVHRIARRIARYEAPIAAFILAVLNLGSPAPAAGSTRQRMGEPRRVSRALLLSRRRHKRGPPLPIPG